MAVSNVAVTATSATVTVSSTDVTNVSVTQNTTDVTVGSAAIIANSDVRAAISLTTGSPSGNGSLTYTESTGVFAFTPADVPDTTDELTEGSTNLYYTSARANTDVVNHIGTVPLTVGGNLNVSGNIIAAGNIDYENVTDLYVTDQKITLNANATTNATVEIIANRPEDTDTLIRWNETTDKWQFTNDGSTYYNLPATLDDVAQGTSNKYFKNSDKNSSLGAVDPFNDYYLDAPAIVLEDEPFRFIHQIESETYLDKIQTVFLTSGKDAGMETIYHDGGSTYVNTTETGPVSSIKGLNIYTQFREPAGTSTQDKYIWRHNSRIALGIQGNSDDEGGGAGNANVAVLLFPSTFQQDQPTIGGSAGDNFTVGKFMLTDGANTLLNNTGDYHPFAPATQRITAPHFYAGTKGVPNDSAANIRVGIATTDLTTSNVLHVAGDIGSTGSVKAVYLHGDGSNISNLSGDIESVTAGLGLTGGGSTGNVTLNVGGNTGITVNTNDVGLDTNSFLNVDHNNVSIIAGDGLSGGGKITADRTLNVGAGDGITVVADDVQLNVAYTRNQFSAGGDLSYNSGTGVFSFSERSNSDILNLVDADFVSDASIHKIAKLRGTEFKIASNATNLVNDVYSYAFPNEDGSNGETLITDGNGTLSFGTVATSYNNASVQNFLENGYGSANILTSGKITQGETRTELIYSVGNTMVLGTETGTPVAYGSNVRIVPGKFSGSDSGTRLVVGDDSNSPYLTFLTGHQSQSLAVGGRLSVNQSLDLGGRYLYLGADQYKGFSTYVDTNTPGNVSLQFGVGNVNTTAGNVNTFAGIRASRDTRDGVRDYSMKMGWFDPIPAEEPNFDSGATNWIPFSDLADTKVDTTFDANLTVTGNLITTGPTISSSDITTTGDFVGDLDGAVLVDVYNDTGGTLNKGQAVYLTGANTGDNPHVNLTENNDSAKMPAIGIVKENISNGFAGQVVTSGVMNVVSHGYTLGADLFINTTAGTLTTTKPTGEDKLIQKIGKVVSSNHILVQGAFRSNEVSSLNSGNIFIGNGSNEAVTADFTDTANTAIADYDGDITPANVTYTGLLTTSGATTGEVTANILGNVQLGFAHSGSSFGDTVMVGDTSAEGGHYSAFGYGGKSLVVAGQAYIGQGLNFGRQSLNISTGLDSTSSTGDGTIALSSLGTFRSNVHIGMPVGNVNGTPNQVVGIKTNHIQDTKLGWYDPLVRTTSGSNSYNKEQVYNPSTAPNGWYAFGDLAKTTFDETFDANLTISGHTHLTAFSETKVDLGSQSGNIAALAAFNASNASIFTVTATGGITISQIPNAVAGSSYTIIVTQDGTGSHALTSTFLYAGADKTLSTAGGSKDIISVVYDGSTYYASLTKGYA